MVGDAELVVNAIIHNTALRSNSTALETTGQALKTMGQS